MVYILINPITTDDKRIQTIGRRKGTPSPELMIESEDEKQDKGVCPTVECTM